MRHRLIGFVLFVLIMPLASAAAPAPQSSSFGGVTLTATPRLSASAWEFELAFNTHTQNLVDDPAKNAQLIVDSGAPYAALDWQGDPPGGHHRRGVLRFKPVTPAPRAIELRIQRSGEAAPRSFRWELR